MAEAPNFIWLSILLCSGFAYYLINWVFRSPTFHSPNLRPPSLRKQLRLQRMYHPKHRYQYHWFKQRMKRKRKSTFRKPKPLFHLTWQFKVLQLTLWVFLGSYKVGCCMERFVYSSLCFVNCLVQSLSLKSLIERFKHRLNRRRANIVAYESLLHPYTTMAKFDTDSFKIGVDTLCSVTMSANKSCFENLKPITGSMVGGIASGLPAAGIGTFCFKLEDCKGKIHTIKLFNSLYVPGLQTTLLCPQHWSQQDKSNSKDDGTYIKTCSNGVWLVWGQHKFKKFVPLDANTNTPTFQTAPGSFNYQAFEATYLAYDASSPRQHTVNFNASQLRGNHELDPAEFIATESINSSGRMGESEGVHDDDKTVHTSNLSHQDADPNGPCPIHPTGNQHNGVPLPFHHRSTATKLKSTMMPQLHPTIKLNSYDGTVGSAICLFKLFAS